MPTLPQLAASGRSKRVAASGRSKRVAASGRRWPLQPVPSDWPQVAASDRFLRFQFPPSKQHPWKIECRAGSLVPMRFFLFFISSTAPGTKTCSQVIRSVAPVMQNHLSKCEDLIVQNATSLRKSAPWPPNMSDCCVFCTAPATRHASLQILFKRPTPAIVFENATKPQRLSHFWLGAESMAPATQKDAWQVQKWSKHVVLLAFWLPNVLRAATACNC